MATQDTIDAHKYEHFEDLQLSARDFYAMLTSMIVEYRYPNVTCSPVTLNLAGNHNIALAHLAEAIQLRRSDIGRSV